MVDVIIPVYRPDEKFVLLLQRLNEQSVKPDIIYIMQTMVEEEENERVREILAPYSNITCVNIDKDEFDHGGTRNLGASMSTAEFMLFMTQDAVPSTKHLIENLLKGMENPNVATCYGRQLANDQAGPIEHYTRRFNYPENSMTKSKKDLDRLGIKTYFCSNVCALYRKEYYDKLGGFVTNTIFNEDMIMAYNVIQGGYEIYYAANASVVHSHKYTYRQQFTRNFDLAVSQKQYAYIFDSVSSTSEGMSLVKKTMGHLLRTGKWYLIFDLVFQSGFKFLGYKFGLRYKKLPMWMVKKMSMNKRYWGKIDVRS